MEPKTDRVKQLNTLDCVKLPKTLAPIVTFVVIGPSQQNETYRQGPTNLKPCYIRPAFSIDRWAGHCPLSVHPATEPKKEIDD
jgi:hypothetical protein